MNATRTPLPPTDRVTMPLLTRITQQSLDEDYQHAADRRARMAEAPVSPHSLRRGTAIVIAVFGIIVTTAAVQTSRNSSDAASSRSSLIAEVNRRNDQVASQETRLRSLRERTLGLQAGLDTRTRELESNQARVKELKAGTGYLPVVGPGVRVSVDDARGGDDAGRVRDEDLAILVDGLWSAGAEAISINNQRLTALAPIRSSGIAIHVNNRPISPPYVILVIGNRANLQSRFADSAPGLEWLALKNSFKFTSVMQNEDRLELPGARLPQLRSAEVRVAGQQSKKSEVAP
jgi:uncharacterized protein YlxW (UPF0749 family)